MLIAINLALSFYWSHVIAWQDHIGGLLTGALLTAAYAYAPAPAPRRGVQAARDHRGRGRARDRGRRIRTGSADP